MRNLVTVYIEVEANKLITKEGRVSLDFEIDIRASQSSTPCPDDVLVQYQFPLVRPRTPPCYYSVANTVNIGSPNPMWRIATLQLFYITTSKRNSYENILSC